MAKSNKTATVWPMRLDRFLAQASGLSRSQVRKLVQRGEVEVDGEAVADATCKVTAEQRVRLAGEPLSLRPPVYLMMNKPAGVISATEDADHQTVIDLLPYELQAGVHPAGRLDRDTTGLVLLTDDGQWSHRVTSPKRQCFKRYRVGLAEPMSDAACDDAREQLSQGILLRGETKPTLPAELIVDSPTEVQILIQEGRYHQVKRMFAALGNRVVRLHREQIGPVLLDSDLAPGQFRPLSVDETAQF
ncbi:MAG: pseudouridine synthase [Halopseudomonas sp.]